MTKRNKGTTGNAEVSIEAHKAKMARIAEEAAPQEADVEERETLASAENAVRDDSGNDATDTVTIPKPGGFDLNKFKSKRAGAIANVDTLPTGSPVHSMSAAKDFVRLNPDEEYWSPELCFVMVPIKGAKRDSLHLIDEDLATRFLPGGKIQHFRLALASKPHDVFFLCRIPTRNLDNSWNRANLTGCEQAKTLWTQATSRGEEGIDGYLIEVARDPDAFPEPNWPQQSLSELLEQAFAGRMITTDNHPALLRLIGAKVS